MSIFINIIAEFLVDAFILSIQNSIASSIKKSLIEKTLGNTFASFKELVNHDGSLNKDLIRAKIKISVKKWLAGYYEISIHEEIFDIIHINNMVSKRWKKSISKNVLQYLENKKIMLKMRNELDKITLIEQLQKGFK